MTDIDTAMAEAHQLAEPAPPPPGIILVEGVPHRRDAKGFLVPDEMIRPQDKLEDEVVRKVLGYAEELSAQVARFKQHTFDDVDGLLGLLDQEYGAAPGGPKGNVTLTTFDGLVKVQVQVADLVSFGPSLQTAKTLVDECLNEWASDARAELKAIVQRAFAVDKEGRVNRANLLYLLRLEVDDERWKSAMAAVRDSMRVIGSKRYCRFYRRAKPTDAWTSVSIDVASV
ncbi:MAG: DUF3164 family protein [Caulobacter sp.]